MSDPKAKTNKTQPPQPVKRAQVLHWTRRFTQFFISVLLFNGYFQVIKTKTIFAGPFRHVCVPGLNCHACPSASMGCIIGMFQHFAATHRFPWFLIGYTMVIGLLSGRLTCGWLCPFGFVQDVMYRFKHLHIPIPKFLNYGKFVVLVVVVLIIPYFTYEHWFSKLCPCGALIGAIPWGLWNPDSPVFNAPTISWDSIGTMYWLKIWILAFFLVIFLFIKRPFCRTICPLGALYAFFNRISLVSLKREDACNDCQVCGDLCPMDLDPATDLDSENCIKCLECTACQNIKFHWNLPWRKSPVSTDNCGKPVPVKIATPTSKTSVDNN